MIRRIIQANPQNVARHYHRCLGFFRDFHVLEMKAGHLYVQTVLADFVESITTTELFYCESKTAKTMKLIGRTREGGDHNEMRSYMRDSELPVNSTVKL